MGDLFESKLLMEAERTFVRRVNARDHYVLAERHRYRE